MLRIKILLGVILALTAWIHPALAVSAIAEAPLENPIFINYEQFHEPIQPILGSDEQHSVAKTNIAKNSKAVESGYGIQNTTPYNGRNYNKEEVVELIKDYSQRFGIDSAAPICIAKLESGYSQFSRSRSSSAGGVFQYLSSTWKSTDEGKAGYSVFDAEMNIKAAIKYMASRKNAKPWTVHTKCPPIKTIN